MRGSNGDKTSRRVTANSFDIQMALDDLEEDDRNRRTTADSSMLRTFKECLDESDARENRLSVESVDTYKLIDTISGIIHATGEDHTEVSALEDSVELPEGRRETVGSTDMNSLSRALEDADDHTVHSYGSVDTMQLIESIGEVVQRMVSESPGVDGLQREPSGVSHRSPRRSRRLSIKSPTATINNSVVADTEYSSAQRELIKSSHGPLSILKSCLSSKKGLKPLLSVKKVVFGSPSAMTFKKDSPAGKFTPVSREKAKSLFEKEETTGSPDEIVDSIDASEYVQSNAI